MASAWGFFSPLKFSEKSPLSGWVSRSFFCDLFFCCCWVKTQIWCENENSLSRSTTACKGLAVGKCESEREVHMNLHDFSFPLCAIERRHMTRYFCETRELCTRYQSFQQKMGDPLSKEETDLNEQWVNSVSFLLWLCVQGVIWGTLAKPGVNRHFQLG